MIVISRVVIVMGYLVYRYIFVVIVIVIVNYR